MKISYSKLWKLLSEKGITRKELRLITGIGLSSISKLATDKCVSLSVLVCLCTKLGVDIGDVVELKPDVAEIQNRGACGV